MDKFEKELADAKNPWIIRIGNHLKSRDDLEKNLKKENKSLDECFRYVLDELSKKSIRENNIGYIAGDDEEIYNLAIHYYDEDDIEVPKTLAFKTNANGTARMNATAKKITSSKDDIQSQPMKVKKHKKEKVPVDQLSFDL